MGLYLCVFDRDGVEREGVEIGAYADFARFRDTITNELEAGQAGTKFPVLNLHGDCDGVWTVAEVESLRVELETIAHLLSTLPPVALPDGWQKDVAKLQGIRPSNRLECFFDIDGEPLIDRLLGLCRVAIECGQPILFQ